MTSKTRTNCTAKRCFWGYCFQAVVWNWQILNQVLESQLFTSSWNRYQQRLSDIKLDEKSEFAASSSRDNTFFSAGKQIEVWNGHATCGHEKTITITSLVYDEHKWNDIFIRGSGSCALSRWDFPKIFLGTNRWGTRRPLSHRRRDGSPLGRARASLELQSLPITIKRRKWTRVALRSSLERRTDGTVRYSTCCRGGTKLLVFDSLIPPSSSHRL